MTKNDFIYALKTCGCLYHNEQIYYEENELIRMLEDLEMLKEEKSIKDMTELEHAIKHIKTRADAWAVKEVTEALRSIIEELRSKIWKQVEQEPIDCASAEHDADGCLGYSTDRGGYSYCQTCLECPKASINNRDKEKIEHDPCETCGYAEGSPFCLQYCPYDAERKKEQESCDKCVYSTKDGYCQYDDITETIPPLEPCEDAISRDAVFDAIEREDKWLLAAKGHNGLTEIAFSGLKARVDALPSVTQKSGHWIETEYHRWRCSVCRERGMSEWDNIHDVRTNFCPDCGARMESEDKE